MNPLPTPVYINKIIQGDALAVLATLPEKSVDLIFADPPYNLQLQQELWRPNLTQVDAVDDDWDQFESFDDYDNFTRQWLTAARRVMTDNATIWISGTYHNIFRVGTLLQDLDFWILNTITWFKPNAMPNFRGTRLKNDIEFIIWAKKNAKSSYTFHHHQMKQFNDFSQGKQLGSVWKIPACGGEERLKGEDGKKLHPTQKPEELLKRIIIASSSPGDVVLDPFSGTGTTAVVAKQLHRQWIGIEQDETYIRASQQRIDAAQPIDPQDPLIQDSLEDKPARIPFKRLIQQGYLKPAQKLKLDSPEHDAVVLDNGLIQANGFTGSIHKVGAQLKNAPSCNGWAHWTYLDKDTGKYEILDVLRKKIRAEDEA